MTELSCKLGFLLVFVKYFSVLTAIRTIDESNCQQNNTFYISKFIPTASWTTHVTIPMLYKRCLVNVINSEFNRIYFYDASVEVFSDTQSFMVDIFVGHPHHNHYFKTLTKPGEKWNGHIPTDEIYIQFSGYSSTTFSISVTIKECMEHCYQLLTPSIISTSIIDLSDRYKAHHCIDNYAVSYHIKSPYLKEPHPINFTIHNNPSVCLTVSDTCCNSQYSCFVGTIRLWKSVYMTINHVIKRPWCLPWSLAGKYLTLTLNTKNVANDKPCIVTLVTNTSKEGVCTEPEVTASSVDTPSPESSTLMAIILTSLGVIVLIICTVIIIYLIVTRARKASTEEVGYSIQYRPHTEVEIRTPPPYNSVAIVSRPSTPSCRPTIEPIEHSARSNPSSVITCNHSCHSCHEPPPPYSE